MTTTALDVDALATALCDAAEPAALLPLDYDPLDLLVALHQIVVAIMLADIPRAQRAAEVAALIASRFPTNALLQAQAAWSKGSALLHVPAYAEALAHYDAALYHYAAARKQVVPDEPPRDVRVVQVNRVFCLTELGRYAEAHAAVALAEQWLADHDHPYAQLTLLLNRSLLAGSTGDFACMIELADATIALATMLNSLARVAQGWINRANACTFLGRLDDAERALDTGIAIATDAGDLVTVARGISNRAAVLTARGQYFAALAMLRDAQRGFASAPDEAATIALGEALIAEQLRQLPEAQRAAQLAATDYRRQRMFAYSATAALRAARIAVQRGQHETAQVLLAGASRDAQQVGLPTLTAEVAVVEAVLLAQRLADGERASRFHRWQSYQAAMQAVETLRAHGLLYEAEAGVLALAQLAPFVGKTTDAHRMYEELTTSSRRSIRLAGHVGLSALLSDDGALSHLQRAAELAVEQRRMLPMEEMQARYSSETSIVHMRLSAHYRARGNIAQALEAVWAAKAGPLLDLRSAAGTVDAPTQVTIEDAKQELGRLRTLLAEYQRQVREAALAGQQERAARFQTDAQAVTQALVEHERLLTDTLRLLGDRAGTAPVPSVADVRDALSPGTVLLEYVVDGAQLHGFVLLPDGSVTVHTLGIVAKVAMLLDRWRIVYHRLMREPTMPRATEHIAGALAPLASYLLAPLLPHGDDVHHLLIAPMGLLHEVPWAALLPRDTADVTLTICGALWTPPPAEAALTPPRVLGYAGEDTRHLSHAAIEVQRVARHLPDAQVVLDATCSDVRAGLSPRLLHIAAHALMVATAPLCSSIELADGPFLLLEAHRLNLRGTQLVTLSACETGARPECGEMTLALAGAFLCAGAQAVVASLWQVSDEAAAALMDQFYAAVAADIPLPQALGQAQRAIRDRYPLDWTAFQLWAGTQLVVAVSA